MWFSIIFICSIYITDNLYNNNYNNAIMFLVILGFLIMYRSKKICLYKDSKTTKYNCICVYIAIVFALLGVSLTYKANENLIENEYDNKKISLQGVIYAISEKANSYAITITDISSVNISTNTINIYNKDHKKIKKILVYLDKENIENFNIGENVIVQGTLSSFIKPTNPGQFNEYDYYVKQQGYSYKIYVDTIEKCREIKINKHNRFYFELKKKLYSVRGTLSKQYYRIIDKQKAAIIIGMLLGDKSLIDEDTIETYDKMGISHILSISGLHISFIGMILYEILSKLKVHTYITNILTILFLFSYGIMTDFSISTNRAVVMMTIMLLGKTFGRTYDVYTAICLSLILILIQNPLIIYNTGLQFSYASVIGIVLVYPILKKAILEKDIDNDKKNKRNKNKGEYNDYNYIYDIRDGINKLLMSFKDKFIAGISIYIVNIPIMLKSYYEISTYSILINIIVLVFVELLMIVSIIAVVISFFSLEIARGLMSVVYVILNIYNMLGVFVDKLKGNSMVLGELNIEEIIVYYVIVVVAIYLIKRNRKYVYVLVLCFFILFDNKKSQINITMLDVSQGDGMCIETINNKVITVDCGSTDIDDLDRYRVEPFLKNRGISIIDYALISHVDTDHISGVEGLLKNYYDDVKIKNIVLPYIEENSDKYKEIVKLAKARGCRVIYVKVGDRLVIDNVSFRCLHPTKNYYCDDENGYSSVFFMSYKNFDMLLTGDIGRKEEKLVLKSMEKYDLSEKSVEVLKVPHHGSKYSSCREFIKKVNPKYALISVGKDNMYGHPHKETIQRYIEEGIKVYTTINNGAITISTNGTGFMCRGKN